MGRNKCKQCGKNCEKEYCFIHKPNKAMIQQVGIRRASKTLQNVERVNQMMSLFSNIWDKRPHKSEVSGEYLGKEILNIFFHHILPKSKYPQAALDEENIILLTLEEHDNVEIDIYRYEEINKRRELLLIKYNLK